MSDHILHTANAYDDWLLAARNIDAQNGAIAWCEDDESPLLSGRLMREHIASMQRLQAEGNVPALAHLLYESIYRHQGDISNPQLYNIALSATKQVIEDYLTAVESALDFIVDHPHPELSQADKLKLLKNATHNLGQPALLLSGGASMGFFHLGVVKAMLLADVLPKILCGASMGSLVGGGICVRNDQELHSLFSDLDSIYKFGIRFLKPGEILRQKSLLDQKQLARCAVENMGDTTFAEAAAHSGREFCVSVSPSRNRQKPRVLSAVTAPQVLVHSAVTASCAIPGIFPSVRLQSRDASGQTHAYLPGESWVDGTFQGDLPMKRLGRLYNVNHFIVSQVNPHAIPFLVSRHGKGITALTTDFALSTARTQAAQTIKVVQARIRNPKVQNVLEHGRLLAEQEYKGDINIHPPLSGWMYRRILSNPGVKDLQRYIELGEKNTWPKILQIRNQTRIQRKVAHCLARLTPANSS